MLKSIIKQAAYTIAPEWSASLDERMWLEKQAKFLRDSCDACESLDGVVDLVLGCPWFRTTQKRAEILALLKLLIDVQPKYLCEIGTGRGGTLFLFSQVAQADAKLLSIDIAYRPAQRKAVSRLAKPGQQITCLAADSHSLGTLERVHEWLDGCRFDFLFIDGDHSLSGVAGDYEMYAPLVREGGVIAFHDIVSDFKARYGIATSSDVGQVPAFWQDLKSQHRKYRELIEEPDQDGYGIGVLERDGVTFIGTKQRNQ